MAIYKIKAGQIITVNADNYVGTEGMIFYDDTGVLRLSDGVTPGGNIITGGGNGSGDGYTGSKGFTGSAGGQGNLGFTGSLGYTGSLGLTGSTGFIGSVGSVGFTGSTGIGFTGSQGTTGYTGSSGTNGFVGSVGFTGSTGYVGSIGYTGSASTTIGYNGSLGYVGSQGYTGSFSTSTLVTNAVSVIGASQPTITSVGTLTGLTVNGGVTATDVTVTSLTLNRVPFVSTGGKLIDNANFYIDNPNALFYAGGGGAYIGGTGGFGTVSATRGLINSGDVLGLGARLNVTGGSYFSGNLYITGITTVTNTTTSVSTVTGALQVAGGVGIGGNLYATNMVVTSNISTTATTNGALVVRGGVGIAGGIITGGGADFNGAVTARSNVTIIPGAYLDTYRIESTGTIGYLWGSNVLTANIATGASTVNIGYGANVFVNGGLRTSSALTVTNSSLSNGINVNYTPYATLGAAIFATGGDTQGGTGYFDFLKVTSSATSATNSSKTFRLSSTGAVEIINSAYNANLLNLSDAGNLSVSGSYQVSGKKAVNGPAFSAYADNTLQTITSGSQQKVLFQVEEFDTDGCFASSRFTPNVEGYYQLNAEVRLDGSSGTGEIMIVLYRNNSEYKRGTNQSGTSIATNFFAQQISTLVYANGTTDYFEIKVQQTSGSSMTVTAVNNPAITWFNGAMVRGA
jgi:hypothetical protein